MTDSTIRVEVVYATPGRQELLAVETSAGATAAEAVQASGISRFFEGLSGQAIEIAIWGRTANPDTVLKDGDRVEILRPLEIDPREARRQLALAGRTMRDESD